MGRFVSASDLFYTAFSDLKETSFNKSAIRDSECYCLFDPLRKCCKIMIRSLTQAIYICNIISLVQFNWYFKRGGDGYKALT